MSENVLDYALLGLATQRCTKGHEMAPWEGTWLRIGDKEWCIRCLEEKLNPLLEQMGIGQALEQIKGAPPPGSAP